MAHVPRLSVLLISAVVCLPLGCAHAPTITPETLTASECLPGELSPEDAIAGLRAVRRDEKMPAALREKLLDMVACMGHEALDDAIGAD